MGTVVQQVVYGIGGELCAEQATAEMSRLECLWSVFRRDSEISELGRRAGGDFLEVTSDTEQILRDARHVHGLTLGTLDITAGPVIDVWRRAVHASTLPGEAELATAKSLVGAHDIELESGARARLKRAGQRIDLGAVGKGYAADRCIQRYRASGIRHALVDIGGNVALLGGKPDGTAWRVGIQAPRGRRGEYIGYVEAFDGSVVTSGSYERAYQVGDLRFSHIIDPRSAWPVENDLVAVTVMHASSFLADAFATACVVLGADAGFELATKLGLAALLLDDRGRRRLTPGMESAFQTLDDG